MIKHKRRLYSVPSLKTLQTSMIFGNCLSNGDANCLPINDNISWHWRASQASTQIDHCLAKLKSTDDIIGHRSATWIHSEGIALAMCAVMIAGYSLPLQRRRKDVYENEGKLKRLLYIGLSIHNYWRMMALYHFWSLRWVVCCWFYGWRSVSFDYLRLIWFSKSCRGSRVLES